MRNNIASYSVVWANCNRIARFGKCYWECDTSSVVCVVISPLRLHS
nr:MAG TPA: hypothetical protein [Caudoviricetes sp.]